MGKPVIAWRLHRLAGLPNHCTLHAEAALRAVEERAL